MACGKRCYTSKKAARNAVGGMHETVRVYFCDEGCYAYHTTQERYNKAHVNQRAWTSRRDKLKKRRNT